MASSDERRPPRTHAEMTAMVSDKLDRGERALDPFAERNQIEILWADANGAEGVMTVNDGVLNPYGTVHGGCLVALADTVAGHNMAASGRLCVTQSSTVNFLRPASGRLVRCRSVPQKLGKSVCVAYVEETDEEGELLTTALFTFCVVRQVKPHVITPKDLIEERES